MIFSGRERALDIQSAPPNTSEEEGNNTSIDLLVSMTNYSTIAIEAVYI